MTDRADLIDKLKRWAWSEQQNADDAKRIYPKASEWYAARAALLREAVKALEIEEATRNQHNVIYGPAGKAP